MSGVSALGVFEPFWISFGVLGDFLENLFRAPGGAPLPPGLGASRVEYDPREIIGSWGGVLGDGVGTETVVAPCGQLKQGTGGAEASTDVKDARPR